MRKQLITGLLATICLLVLLCGIYPLAVTAVAQVAFKQQADGSLVHSGGRVVGSRLIGQEFLTDKGDPDPRYFQPRPSAAGTGYDSTASGAANLGPSNPLLIGFVPGVNTVGLDGTPSKTNPFATAADPYCVPTDPKGSPVTSPGPGQQYAKASDGSYACDPATAPELAIAYRAFNNLAPGAKVPADAVTSSGSGLDPDISEANALAQAARVATARNLPAAQVIALVRAHVDSRPWGFLGEPAINVLDLNLALDAMK